MKLRESWIYAWFNLTFLFKNKRRFTPVDKITQHENQNSKATNGFNVVIMNSLKTRWQITTTIDAPGRLGRIKPADHSMGGVQTNKHNKWYGEGHTKSYEML
mgnify:CR=1 FL=1